MSTAGSNNPFPSVLLVEGTTPTTPSSGKQRVYARSSDGKFCRVNSSGTVFQIEQDCFKTIAVSGQSDVVADSTTDTLTLAAGSNVTITTNPSTDTITIAASGGGVSDGDKGDVTVSSSGATWTIDNSAVTLAKIANAAASSKLLGSGASGSGSAYAELTLGTNLSMSGTTLNAAGASVSDGDKGDVTVSSSGATWTIDNSAVTLAKIANAAASSKLVGSGASGSGSAYAELTLGTNLSMSGTTLNATGGGSGNTTYSSALASPPGSPASGDVWYITNAPYVGRYNGASWDYWYQGVKTLLPSSSGPSTWVNQNSATVSTANGVIALSGTADAGPGLQCLVKTAPATPYTITCQFQSYITTTNFAGCGLMFRDSGSGKIVGLECRDSTVFEVNKWNSATSFSAAYSPNTVTATTYIAQMNRFTFRITDNGTNRITSFSIDGYTFVDIHSVGRTDFLTADQVGIFVRYQNATYIPRITAYTWVEA